MKIHSKHITSKASEIYRLCPACPEYKEIHVYDWHEEKNGMVRTGHECHKCGYVWDEWWRIVQINGYPDLQHVRTEYSIELK